MIFTEKVFEEIDIDYSTDGKIRMNSFNTIMRKKTIHYFFGIPYRMVCYQRVDGEFWKGE